MWSVPRADIRGELHQGPQQELALAPLQAQITSHGLNMELDLQCLFGLLCTDVLHGWDHGGTWSNHTYVALALSSLLATCVVFWSHRRCNIVNTAVMFSPERMYITLDSSACKSYPSLKRYKCIWRFTDSKVELQKSLQWSYIYLC